jgi:HlyD family secretion protein
MVKNIFSKIKGFALSHKILSIVILIIIVSSPFVINYLFPKKATVNYVTQAVKKANIDVAITGTGQVSSLKNVSLVSEVSSDVTGVYVTEGEKVNQGDLLFKTDSTDAIQSVKNAELALESAKLSLEELQKPVDELTILQSENSLIDAQNSKSKAASDLEKAYDDGFTEISNTFLDLPSVMTGLNSVLFSKTINPSGSQQNIDYYATAINYYDERGTQYRDDAYNKYIAAKKSYDDNLAVYKTTSRFSDKTTIETLISETYDTTKSIAETIKSANNLVEFYKYTLSDRQQSYNLTADTHLSSLSGYSSKVNNHISNLLSAKTTIVDDKDSIISADRSIKVKELSLEDVKDGATDLEIRTQQLAINQKQQALDQANITLAKYSIRAPFSGIVSSVDVSRGDSVNSGTVMGAIITDKMIATVTLNEVDIAKIKVGQKVKLTFDALDNVVVDGEVAEVDAVGTVSQGVVSYTVKISFTTDNESIKPGMSISASIITESVADVLTVPSSAVKTMGQKSYVEVMNSNKVIERKTVEIGITNDTLIEIKSGIVEGDKVVTSTTTSTKKITTTKTTTTKSSTQSGPGAGGDMMMLTR